MTKAIIYGRVSTTKQDYTRQINELSEYATRNDIEVLEVFTDVQSGKTKARQRKAAKEMFSYIRTNKVDIVLVSEISRIGRSAIDVQKNIDTIVNEIGIDLYIHQQGMRARDRQGNVNSAFKLVTDVLANVAQMEREQISERVKSGLQEAKRKGKILGRPTGSAQTDQEVVKKYPKVVRELRTGLSLRKIAAIANVSVNTVRKVKSALEAA